MSVMVWLRTSIAGKILLFIGMLAQGLMMRRLCCDLFDKLGYQSSQDERSMLQPIHNNRLQMDVMVPAFERDDQLKVFAQHLGTAIEDYNRNNSNHNREEEEEENDTPRIETFRFLVTRFGPEQNQSDALRQELVTISGIPPEQIILVLAGDTKFSRARALNLLHEAACHRDNCLVTRLDVDMEVKSEFFYNAVKTVIQRRIPPLDDYNQEFQTDDSIPSSTPVAYFPIVWSRYNPESVALVEQHLRTEFEKDPKGGSVEERLVQAMPQHRGHWRRNGKGMYVILGSDAGKLEFNTKYEGWGFEDVDFYNKTVALPRRIARGIEPGLIHAWHAKSCVGKDASTKAQSRNCLASVVNEAGSDLGRYLLWEAKQARKKANEQAKSSKKANEETTTREKPNPIPRDLATRKPVNSDEQVDLQFDVMVPVYERDDRLRAFAFNLGQAIEKYQKEEYNNGPRITIFRLIVTRFTEQEIQQSVDMQKELSMITGLPVNNIVMVKAEGTAFSRARALNMLHEAACHLETCLITRLDVDMEVREEFFQHAIETVYLMRVPPLDEFNEEFRNSSLPEGTPTAYFPIVWSAYNPATVKAVEEHYEKELRKESPENIKQRLQETMPEFSEHRGHWRPYGKGMYVIQGSDALKLTYDTTFEGWGGEDVNFYNRTVDLPRRILRGVETGLIHTWHPKFCDKGKDAFTPTQIRNCRASVRKEEGSPQGIQLLAQKNARNNPLSKLDANKGQQSGSESFSVPTYEKRDGKVYLVK